MSILHENYINITAQSCVGQERATNEDVVETASFGATHLLIITDGMGGHAVGDIASELPTTTISEAVPIAIKQGRSDWEAIFSEAIVSNNDAILEVADDTIGQPSMGATVVASIIADCEAVIGNVGDSRAYIVDGELTQVAVDQSLF